MTSGVLKIDRLRLPNNIIGGTTAIFRRWKRGRERGWRCARAGYLLRAALNAYLDCAGPLGFKHRLRCSQRKRLCYRRCFSGLFRHHTSRVTKKKTRHGQLTCHHNVRLPCSLSTSMREQKHIMTPIHFVVVALSASHRKCRSPLKSHRCNRCELRLPTIPPASLIMKICAHG
jgi:hypothetical protein